MSAWQPIETAPRDGTRFLAFSRKGHLRIDRRHEKQSTISPMSSLFWEERPDDRYTHWMPLPEPPK